MAKRETSAEFPKIQKCKVCKMSFPDEHAFSEHLDSNAHKKRIMKEKYGEKYLEAKVKLEEKTTSNKTTPVLEEKSPTLPSKNLKLKLEDDTTSENNEDDVYTCEVCRKICTGYVSYQLHLAGKKHHKNLKKAKLLKYMEEDNLIPKCPEEKPAEERSLLDLIMTKTQFASSDIECQTCKKKCCGPESFRQHCNSARHQKKLAMQSLLEGMKAEGKSPATQEDDSIFASCDVCQKNFSGPLPYQQHMESFVHLRQVKHVQELSKIKDLFISSEDDPNKLKCKECGKICSGPVPFNAHLKSLAHEKLKKKNVQLEDLRNKYPELLRVPIRQDSDDSENRDEDDTVMYGCNVCHLVCSGPESAKEHFASAKHKKAVKKNSQFQKYMQQKEKKPVEDSGSQVGLATTKDVEEDNSDSDDEFDFLQGPEI